MKNLFFILGISISTMFFFSCSENEFGFDPFNNYPLVKELTWQYQRTVKFYNFRPFQLGEQFNIKDQSFNIRVLSEGKETLPNGTLTNVLSAQIINTLNNTKSKTYYIDASRKLFRYAYRIYFDESSYVLPKSANNFSFSFKNKKFFDLKSIINFVDFQSLTISDSIIIEETPRLVYSYPMRVGNKWNFFDSDFMKIDKEIIDQDTVHTPIGIFNAYIIKWKYRLNGNPTPDIEAIECVAARGLIKRTFFINNITIYPANSPEGIGLIDMIDETIITK